MSERDRLKLKEEILEEIRQEFIVLPRPAANDLPERSMVMTTTLAALVCEFYGVSMNEMRGDSRKLKAVRARAVTSYIARNVGGLCPSTTLIGTVVNRKHCHVIYLVKHLAGEMETNKYLRGEVEVLREKFILEHGTQFQIFQPN